ncbi:NAD(P)/FAD-dependent oxidoreductase, partial [Arthrobacter deserti]|nr:NAD(P)/FAD-dependent oxidoreductase [Arthrobacter deserti]
DVGGTWYWNRYPGARCDIESVHYSYSFSDELQQEWEWSEKFAAQPEILRYLNHVADRFDLRRSIQFNTRVTSMVWDEENTRWTVTTDDGATTFAKFVISGAGNLSVPKKPEFPGVEDFRGEVYLTGNWPHEPVDFAGKRVGIVGTGSTGIQAISETATEAAHLTVFQRTPNYASPIGNGPADPAVSREAKANYRDIREASRNHFLGVPYNQVQ